VKKMNMMQPPPELKRQSAYNPLPVKKKTVRFVPGDDLEKQQQEQVQLQRHSDELPLTLLIRCGQRVTMVMMVSVSYEKLLRPAVPWVNFKVQCRGRSPYCVVTTTVDDTICTTASLVSTTIQAMLDDCMLEHEDNELCIESFFGRRVCFPATAKWASQRMCTHQSIYDHLVTVFGFIGKIYG